MLLRRVLAVRAQSTLASRQRPDPFTLLAPQLASLRTNLLALLGSGHPAITELAQYYFHHHSKQVRPLLILLLSQATNGLGKHWSLKLWESTQPGAGGGRDELDVSLAPPDVLNDFNPYLPEQTRKFHDTFTIRSELSHRKPYPTQPKLPPRLQPPALHLPTTILPTQLRFAQIVELIHTASLLHDDVIDAATLRRGAPSALSLFDSKLSVLGGNFILGRASAALARLGDQEVTRLSASVISNLVEGEILQTKDAIGLDDIKKRVEGESDPKYQHAWNTYMQKTYLKTASLMAKGARCAVILGGCAQGEIWKEVAYAYGRNLGLAFQLVDDVLDYESASATLGKPGGADLQLGLATAPALYAWEQFPEMGELIRRKFAVAGDVEKARDLVQRSSAIARTKELAVAYANAAKEVLLELPESEARDALEVLAERVVGRKA